MQSICIYADPMQYQPIAIVVPMEPILRNFLITKGLCDKGTLEDVVRDTAVAAVVLEQLQSVGRRGGLCRAEMIQGVVLGSEDWTPENVCCIKKCGMIDFCRGY